MRNDLLLIQKIGSSPNASNANYLAYVVQDSTTNLVPLQEKRYSSCEQSMKSICNILFMEGVE